MFRDQLEDELAAMREQFVSPGSSNKSYNVTRAGTIPMYMQKRENVSANAAAVRAEMEELQTHLPDSPDSAETDDLWD